jgi:hypothetical protein
VLFDFELEKHITFWTIDSPEATLPTETDSGFHQFLI